LITRPLFVWYLHGSQIASAQGLGVTGGVVLAGLGAIPADYGTAVAPTLDFTPVVCLTASETAHPKRGEFV
jgi:hypothetical protein